MVRSSSSNEDGLNTSNAGHYESILGVDPSDGEAVVRAVREVLDSYKCDLDDVSGEQVLIQRQITNISYSGVIFSREIKKDRPYYTITYDDSSTDAVTSGRGGKTVYIIRNVMSCRRTGLRSSDPCVSWRRCTLNIHWMWSSQ